MLMATAAVPDDDDRADWIPTHEELAIRTAMVKAESLAEKLARYDENDPLYGTVYEPRRHKIPDSWRR